MRPRRAMASTRSFVMSCPSNAMRPPSTAWAPTIEENSVVLPEPFGPISPTMAPCGTLIEIARLATTPPNDFVTPLTSSSASMSGPNRRVIRARLGEPLLVDRLAEPLRPVHAQPVHDPLREEHDDQHDQQAQRHALPAEQPGPEELLRDVEHRGADDRSPQGALAAEHGHQHHPDAEGRAREGQLARID